MTSATPPTPTTLGGHPAAGHPNKAVKHQHRDNHQARRALNALRAEFERVRRPLVCASGTVLVLGNRRVVHARDAFTARYDGADRWLRKLIVSRSSTADSGEPYDRVRI